MADDGAVIGAVLDGDVDRYAELVTAYQAQARRLAFSLLGSEEDAKDASQEAFVSAYRSLRRFRRGAKFSTWLYRIVVNACRDVSRRRVRHAGWVTLCGSDAEMDGVGLFEGVEDPAAPPNEQAASREVARQLSDAIGALPMKQRTAFVLHHLHGVPLKEIADVMRCRLGTVKSHVFRATEHLREHLGPWWEGND